MKESTKDKVGGKISETKGKLKEKTGRALRDPVLEDEGRGEKIGGKVRKKIGDVKKVFEL